MMSHQQQQQQLGYDNYELLQHIQHSVLGDDHYHSGPSSFEYDDHWYRRSSTPPTITTLSEQHKQRIVQILILDRKSSSRDFAHVNDIILALQNYRYIDTSNSNRNGTEIVVVSTTQFRFNVTYVPSFDDHSLYEQAYLMHHADIVYSPHGAQLSNLIYIRPCTVSVEFFPLAYYLQFFQSLAVSARGISFEGYPSATFNYTDKVADSQVTAQHKHLRYAARNTRINVGPDFFIQTLPQLMNAKIQCHSTHAQNIDANTQ